VPATVRSKTFDVSVVMLDSLPLQRQAAELYRSVFAYSDPLYAVSPRLLSSLLINGGSAIGLREPGGRLVAFSYGYPGIADGTVFHFSQATVVLPELQGQGIGRLMKHAQADIARAAGAESMRWLFDPISVRNAHFNLESLEARGRAYYPAFYHEPATERMLVEWALTERAPAGRLSAPARDEIFSELQKLEFDGGVSAGGDGEHRWVVVPAQLPEDPSERLALRSAVGDACARAFDAGFVAVGCRRLTEAGSMAAYLFEEVIR
jgi:predicted GNAT superfamily acetyltransferase